MIDRARNHPVRAAVVGAVLTGGLAWLAFGYFAVHTLFVDERVSEAAPVFDAVAEPGPSSDPSPAEPDIAGGPTTTEDPGTPGTPPVPTAQPTTQPTVPRNAPSITQPPTPAGPVTEWSGTFESGAHATRGEALVIGNGTGQRFLRLEDFETDNGPDLNVYLVSSATGDASDAVDLGDLKGNIGDQNYEIPTGVDVGRYDRVVIWCVRFGVAFGSADLTAIA